jgi:AAA+ superfamily predicted ATPase
MSQSNLIKDIAKYGLGNDREKLLTSLNKLVEHSKNTRKVNLALELQSIIKNSIQNNRNLVKVGSKEHYNIGLSQALNELILEKIISEYRFENLICNPTIKDDLRFLIEEHNRIDELISLELPVSNKILLHGPSGCGKTLASYVLAGELKKPMYVVNLGAVVSSKLGETSKNLAKIFKQASAEESIIFIDEFDSIGKLRDYNQDHGEMKRVVNTILQLMDYLPQKSLVICATNQVDMIDDALKRRFDMNLKFEKPNKKEIEALINLTLKSGKFKFDRPNSQKTIIGSAIGLSYYSVQKTLITAIKRSLFQEKESLEIPISTIIDSKLWQDLIEKEKEALKL